MIIDNEILEMAKQCGDYNGQTVEMNDVGLERFARLVEAKTREECAAICEEYSDTGFLFAAAIRNTK